MESTNSNNAKMDQLLMLLTEKQEQFRNTTVPEDKIILQTEIDGLQSDLQFLEAEQQKVKEQQHIQEQQQLLIQAQEQRKEQRISQMEQIQNEAKELFRRKNNDYGDAFATYGPVGVLVRMGDKISRLQNISNRGITLVEDERMRDTLIDLHNYAAMAIMLLDEENSDE